MKWGLLSLCLYLLISGMSAGAEVIEILKTRNGREYHKVEILSQDEVGLKIRHEGGTARVAFELLPDDLKARFHYDPQKAEALRQKERQQQAAHEAEPPSEPVAPNDPNAVPVAPSPSSADANSLDAETPPDGKERAKLEAYLQRMRAQVESAQLRVTELLSLANQEMSKTRTVNDGLDYRGQPKSRVVPDKSSYAKGRAHRAEADALSLKISKAKTLIAIAQANLESLDAKP